MSTAPSTANPSMVRGRDDLLLGSPEQDYLLRVEPVEEAVKADEDWAAALTVCGKLGTVYPHLSSTEVRDGARAMLAQLGLLDDLILRGKAARRREQRQAA